MSTAFAGYPTAFVYESPDGDKVDHLLWGDYIRLLGPKIDGWVNVRARGKSGWMRERDIQPNRLLEVNFVDIGQGDGCFIVTPDDKFLLVDAGEGDNMYRFLRWRFNLKNHPEQIIPIQAAVISHPDSDHYRGFAPIFDDKQFHFETVYHNGIIERAGENPLGPRNADSGVNCLTDVVTDLEELKRIIDDDAQVGTGRYAKVMRLAARGGRVKDIRMLCMEDGFMPGYEQDKELVIRVLGPVPEPGQLGRRLLRWFTDKGKTKNGHSVVFKLEYGGVRILLGGDLNIPAEEHLLSHYTGMNAHPASSEDADRLVAEARKVFEADVAKACHHGSADFTSLYLRAVNPIATVISSGDNESHAHPRPDALGTLGRWGRGERPLIFSTELARSSKDTIRNPNALRAEIQDLFKMREQAEDEDVKVRLDGKIQKLLQKIERTVSVYGLINLRTDGKKAVLAQKLEKASPNGEWDVHRLEPDTNGELRYISKH